MHPDSPLKEQSYGVIPLKFFEGEWLVLLIQHGSAKYWGFPKGHGEPGETPLTSAVRELKEETDLEVVQLLSDSVLEVSYHFMHRGRRIDKSVWFFIAEVSGEVTLQQEEVSDARWVALAKADEILTYENDKSIARSVLRLLEIE